MLYSCLSRLRTALPGTALLRRPGGYVASVGPRQVDLHRFDQLVTTARAAPDAAARPASYDEALGLWRDRPFSGLDGPWFDGVRDRLERDRMAANLRIQREAGSRLDQAETLLVLGREADLRAVIAHLA